MALLALSCIDRYEKIKKELYLNEITGIIKYHQERHNLRRLAYQSAWMFLINRLLYEESLEEVIMNELCFVEEARRELEELSRNVDWKREKEENETRRKETKEEVVLLRWIRILNCCFFDCQLHNEEFSGLINNIVQLYRASRDNYRDISEKCIYLLRIAVENFNVKIDEILKGRAVDAILEEIQQRTIDDGMAFDGMTFFFIFSLRLKEEGEECEKDKEERKVLKRKLFEKMEEEGREDRITSFQGILVFLQKKYHNELLLNISDYYVNT
ncbi:uncharacterized protein MONOS_18612 [Monocercomonoides exilis]|uniref:uncharacterized protein n=1 Tax=Monocercomonoides exilis TaxID=2049356 RepID=UPI003559EA47|nr:hypothetical protein MONOS_18612 [Monocercomonoides exilis]